VFGRFASNTGGIRQEPVQQLNRQNQLVTGYPEAGYRALHSSWHAVHELSPVTGPAVSSGGSTAPSGTAAQYPAPEMVPASASRTMHDTMLSVILFMEFHGEVLAYGANKKSVE